MARTALGREVASAYAALEGLTVKHTCSSGMDHLFNPNTSANRSQICYQMATSVPVVAYGLRVGPEPLALDV
jgi:hypothetical protein